MEPVRAGGPTSRHNRTTIAVGLVGMLVIALVGVGSAISNAGPVSATGTDDSLEAAGTALQPAERIALRPPPVPEGMLPFPVRPGADCYVLDNFGDGRSGGRRLHEGDDIMGSAGNEVYAVVSGVLTKRYMNEETIGSGWGWTLYDSTTNVAYRYFHMTDDPAGFAAGDRVEAGDVLGFVGSSGTNSETNFHLHFEVRPNNVAVNPLPLLFIDRSVCGVSPPLRGLADTPD